MIDQLYGTIIAAQDNAIIIDTGAIAFSVNVPDATSFTVRAATRVHIYMHWNSENGPSLFGFANETDRTIFEQIISCSGLGPKIGLAILGQLGSAQFIEAVQTGKEEMLSQVSGIGPKKAEQIIIQLRHKISKLLPTLSIKPSQNAQVWHDAQQALASLGYARSEIRTALDHVRANSGDSNLSFDQLMRTALSFLSKKG